MMLKTIYWSIGNSIPGSPQANGPDSKGHNSQTSSQRTRPTNSSQMSSSGGLSTPFPQQKQLGGLSHSEAQTLTQTAHHSIQATVESLLPPSMAMFVPVPPSSLSRSLPALSGTLVLPCLCQAYCPSASPPAGTWLGTSPLTIPRMWTTPVPSQATHIREATATQEGTEVRLG
jgi:hypothetical protein